MNATEEDVIDHEELDTEQYLTFIMDGEEYGIDILAVQEIRGWESATPIPHSPPYMKGVINLRGTIVPIMDLRARFSLPFQPYTEETVVVVLKVATDSISRTMGIIVDAISDVYDIPLENIKSTSLADNQNSRFIKGLVTVKERMVILLELEKLLTLD
ncbi:purine-binding chemotaxis protein CheW [Bermanella marisrubri]|uniref:Chemotaxis protein CheW n=1 Tax=Bermanella marisrubri TaxID=207949 RepID=Q1N2W6_9GAMM|nr:chemotaxis protein CheW [Bermanella marisrubri]EAT12553.1 CheW protein [Oceanobacter sp. RED65] [Bermanella marisrubri]QIZ84889.1 purine-binding chemotaxis protein CheW [Bermanella marisrubri]